MDLIFLLFWVAILIILYTYLIFPLIVALRGLLFPRPYQQAEITPKVSLIIAAYNEAEDIGAKLDTILALDYPPDRLDVLVASDGSDDGTNEIVQRYAKQGVRLLSLPRQGKASALNAAVVAATGEMLVFTDANSMFAPDALRALMRPFSDRKVGGVAGNQRYLPKSGSSLTGDGEKSYWNFDRLLKQLQSRAGNVISATGAIYAIRRHLFQSVPDSVTDDFVTSTRVIAQGYRLVFAADAVVYEPAADSSRAEFRRKVRVITRGLRAVFLMRELLNPFHYGFYALQLFSHKVLRRMVVFPLLVLFLVNPLLWFQGWFYQFFMVAQIGFYGCAVVAGMLLTEQRGLINQTRGKKKSASLKILSIPFYFCLVNTAALLAVSKVLRGQRIDRWDSERQITVPPSPEKSSL